MTDLRMLRDEAYAADDAVWFKDNSTHIVDALTQAVVLLDERDALAVELDLIKGCQRNTVKECDALLSEVERLRTEVCEMIRNLPE